MRRSDKEAVMELLKGTDMFTDAELVVAEEVVDDYLDEPEQRDYINVVWEDDSQTVIGYLSFGPTPMTEGTHDLYWMAISSAKQGSGLGTRMLSWMEQFLDEAGARLILIETSSQPKYEATRQFYSGRGFREVSRIVDFYRPGDDRVTYAKYLGQRS